ncbi:MAG: LUD domain-containing protein, partial [Polyangiaceae bacterium]|nr:LUD domain-containing protein [Polyangiaceae bacterium]
TVAKTPAQACEHITRLVLDVGIRVTKSKSMTSEEVGLNAALQMAGVQVTETDLGELIVQLANQPPSHVTAPAIHLSTEDIAHIFAAHLGMQPPAWVTSGEKVDETQRRQLARDLSLHARAHLRERFLQADVGISGANFLVAESGTVVLVENEGNIRLTTCLPKRHVVLAGLDKLVATDADLGVLLRVLPVSATAQRQACYVSLFADSHPDMHVVLLDHGRTELLHDPELRDLLACIRCGACMNACPVYRNVGGHAYGGAYPGPIGALLLPHFEGQDKFADLPFASSLCGACTEVCPVKIPLHEHLLRLRARLTERGLVSGLGWTLGLGALAMSRAGNMELVSKLYPLGRSVAALTPAGRAWTSSRELPAAPRESFRAWWRRERAGREVRPAVDVATYTPKCAPKPALPPKPNLSLRDRFTARMAELGPSGESELHLFEHGDAALAFVRARMAEHHADQVLVQGEVSEKRQYALGVTTAVLLIADTGGIVLDLPDRLADRACMLVDTHLVLAHTAQLVPGMDEALQARSAARAQGQWGDLQLVVTGASRTADVEKVLVIPAHGPCRLVVALCDEPVEAHALVRPSRADHGKLGLRESAIGVSGTTG